MTLLIYKNRIRDRRYHAYLSKLLICFCFICGIILAAQANNQPKIINKPIQFGKTRISLTRQYRCKHYKLCTKSIKIVPRMIVLHWTAEPTLQQAYQTLYPATLSGRSDIEKASTLNVSAHYLVARNGVIYKLMPDNWMARHVIGLNYLAIGIENVGGTGGHQNLTPAQVNANVYLIRMLKHKYPSIKYLIGHSEYRQFRNTPLWKETDPDYITSKIDPGPKFMHQVRKRVKCLDLLSRYQSNS